MAKQKLQRDSMVFYKSFYEAIKELEPVQQAEVYNAVFEFAFCGTEPKISGVVKTVFTLIRPQIVANNARYANGQKGGRTPKKSDDDVQENSDESHRETETKVEPNRNQSKTKQEPNCNQDVTKPKPNENDNVNVNDNVNGNDSMTDEESKFTCSNAHVAPAHDAHTRVKDYFRNEDVLESVGVFLLDTLHIDVIRNKVECVGRTDFLEFFDEVVDVISHPWSELNTNDLFKLDTEMFWSLFDKLCKIKFGITHDLDGIKNLSRYIWTAIANAVKGK